MNEINAINDIVREGLPHRYFKITKDFTPVEKSTSKGNQRKWYYREENIFVKEQFLYQNKLWRDDLVELIGSGIGNQLICGSAVLQQGLCYIEDAGVRTRGVYSNNFLMDDESFVSFADVLNIEGKSFLDHESVDYKFNFVLDLFKDLTGLDLTNYLVCMSMIDYLIGNEDRHLNNFGVICGNKFKEAPLFDFGLGLFEHDLRYEGEPLRSCIHMMVSKPFHTDNQVVIDYLSDNGLSRPFLPETLDLSSFEFPSKKARAYVRNRCIKLGITLVLEE